LVFIQEPPLCAYERNDEGDFTKLMNTIGAVI